MHDTCPLIVLWKYFTKTVRSPVKVCKRIWALSRGIWYIVFYRITKKDVVIRFPFWVYCRVHISGPGRVFIDRGCETGWNNFYYLNIETLSENAKVVIGKGCGLSGVTIRCAGNVVIKDNTWMAATLIQDINIVSQRVSKEEIKPGSSIIIGKDVWCAANAIVLANSIIGDGSVIGSNGLIYNFEVPSKCLAAANPVRRCVPTVLLQNILHRSS